MGVGPSGCGNGPGALEILARPWFTEAHGGEGDRTITPAIVTWGGWTRVAV
ncbi:hypothetical protein GCM10020220_100830 [Nonomuraea rubra]